MLLPEFAEERLVDQVFRVIDLHLQLFKNHALFFRDILGVKPRIQDEVGNEVERASHVFV